MKSENGLGLVSVRQIKFDAYPTRPPFDPGLYYCELANKPGPETNAVYDAVRNVLRDLVLDKDHIDTKDWSPFRDAIKPGDKVIIKPNLVLDCENQDAITTHASVIRPIVDYVWKALAGSGSIVICDAPVVFADFDNLAEKNGLRDMVQNLRQRGYNLELIDLRARKVKTVNNVVVGEFTDPEKARQAVIVDLREASCFADGNVKQNRLAYGSYDRSQIKKNHNDKRHCYSIAKLILEADAVICMPKLKTHKKAGITCCLKNIVGINVDKNHLPHYTSGPANWDGDEFPRLPLWRIPILQLYKLTRLILLGFLGKYTARTVSSLAGVLNKFKFRIDAESPSGRVDTAQRVYRLVTGTDYGGSWGGNETIWRMILDLNRIFLIADAEGNLTAKKQRNAFFIVDGFISGVKNGPLTPHIVKPGIVAAGFNGALVDKALLQLAGIDAREIPLFREAFSEKTAWLHDNLDVQVRLNGKQVDIQDVQPIMKLHEPTYWKYSRH